jgi:hypothetical protein
VAARKIDDAEPGMRQPYAILYVKSSIVRPAMGKHPDHPSQGFWCDRRSIKIEHASYATHFKFTLGKGQDKGSIAAAPCSKSHSSSAEGGLRFSSEGRRWPHGTS